MPTSALHVYMMCLCANVYPQVSFFKDPQVSNVACSIQHGVQHGIAAQRDHCIHEAIPCARKSYMAWQEADQDFR